MGFGAHFPTSLPFPAFPPSSGAAFWFSAPVRYATEPKIAVNFSNSA
ncbi:hypothetical protein SLEP1_g58356 [Rubroshorea leprosula]|uniref:Uncharacterized protein n=1 Tax=Rubroshorea leprosula TaxID=152421 RepID=A0AAV5MSN9_9ROSI|nr:hypothetical protein SLEP1_g58356 [Rubroshorea leprosula]